MPDINTFAPTVAAAQLDPDSVQATLTAVPTTPDVPAVTAAQIEFMMKLYAAGERDPEALARCASCDIDSATTLVAEFDALSGAIAASPAEPMINTYDPAQAAQPGGGKVGPVGPAPAKIV
jgi:hypothetical protein